MIIGAMAVAKAKKVKVFPFDLIVSWLVFALPLVALIFFLPLGLPLEFSKQVIVAVLVCLGFGLFFLARLQDQTFSFPGYPLLLAFFSVVLVSALSGLFSSARLPALFGLGGETSTTITFAFGLVITFLTSLYLRDKTRIFWLMLGLLIGFLLVFLTQIVQLITSWNFVWIGFSYDAAVFAGLAAVLSLSALELWPLKTSPWRWFMVVALVLSLAYLALANLVPLWFLITLVSLILLVYQLVVSSSWTYGVLRPSFFVLVVSLLFFPLLASHTNLLGSSLNWVGDKIGWSRPLEIKYPATSLFGQLPETVLGTGPSTFTREWIKESPTLVNRNDDGKTIFPWGLGTWLRAPLETGWLGVVSWLAFLGTLLFYGAKFLNQLFAGKRAPGFFLIFLGAVYLWCLNLFYAPGFALTALTFTFTGLVVAEAAGLGFIPSLNYEAKGVGRTIFVTLSVLLLIASVLGGYFFLQRLVARYHFTRALAYSQEANQTVAVRAELARAIELEENDLYLRALTEWGTLRLNELLASSGLPAETLQQEASAAITTATTAGQQALAYRESAENWFTLGSFYERLIPLEINGASAEAMKAYQAAQALSPYDPVIRQAESRLAEAAGDLNQAAALAGDVVRLAPTDFTAWFRLGVLAYRLNDMETARLTLERALVLNPGYANARYFLGLTYDKLGLRDAALDQFTAVEQTNPDNQDVKAILNNLRSGQPALSTGE